MAANEFPGRSFRLPSAAASINASVVKASPGRLFKITGYNAKGSGIYLKLYNQTTAPAPATDVPVITEYIAASGKFDLTYHMGMSFSQGIAFVVTGAVGDTDTTAILAADLLGVNFLFH